MSRPGSLSKWLVQLADGTRPGESESSAPAAGRQRWEAPPAALTATASPVSACEDEDISWLWPGKIPYGMVTLIEGDPGQGKSTVTLDLAARLSTGRAMPGEHGGTEPQTVLLLSAEDSVTVTVRRRLRAAGADLTRVHVLDEMTTADGRERLIELPGDLPAIEELIRRLGATLVVIDPLTVFLTDKTDSNSDHSVRRALWPVHRMAQRTAAAVVVVRHLTKAGGSKAIYRGGGSIGIAAAARAVYLIAPDPDDENRRLFAKVKLNIAKAPPTLSYRLEEVAEHGCARVAWSAEPVTLTAADLLAGSPAPLGRPALARAAAEDLLRHLLADGPVPASQIREAGVAAGISWETMQRARHHLYVISEPDPHHRGRGQAYRWRLRQVLRRSLPQTSDPLLGPTPAGRNRRSKP